MNYKIIFILPFILILSNCTILKRIIYQENTHQGNFLNINLINKIKKNMSKKQIINILGYPYIINYKKNNTIWYYIFIQRLNNKLKQKTIILIFNNKNKLINIKKINLIKN
ncbi:outer membrane protein assembly factor BamE domain-containing protein [Enterobacteriaceae endosymbiont of Plateumaris rustica]|uniref:outer membrane protein assembly factor BamE domain-containing protein n=1 Tax=Enterobacteriaceae endosymbiont of Plateumaris rustica TaxID=2675796 RepID=UPI001448C299|nr:outer membrane protein assembly factor BamE [Enterobacteriaceae endosymbiont of Plateumaris rustica]QJC29233.1 outer membrane protein assembly factor BamE [Enterobacteriaceae endosymbiont of Plateumaris rustica]